MNSERADQYECTKSVLDVTPDAAIISNLGVSSYILIDVEDRDRNFYMNGAMGLTTPMGFGLAMSIDDQVTVFEGDGSLLMSMGSLSSLGTYNPPNLTIIVWNNGVFQTTGGQPTLAETTDFGGVAEDCGIKSWTVESNEEFQVAYTAASKHEGTALVVCSVTPERPEGYPQLDYSHSYLKNRFRQAILPE